MALTGRFLFVVVTSERVSADTATIGEGTDAKEDRMDREQRKAEAQSHLALMKGAFEADTRASIDAAHVYEDGDGRSLELPEAPFSETKTFVTTRFAPRELFSLQVEGKVCVVDPCSFTRPGGSYEDGAFGPEQVLCADSNLYPVLLGCRRLYYAGNRGYASGQLFTDRALYLPDIAFTHNGEMRRADVIALPEPNRSRALENHRSEAECDECLKNRIETLLSIAAANGAEALIVGAFACGRQGFDPDQVTGLFKEWLDAHPGAIGTVAFAVPRAFEEPFSRVFGREEVERRAPRPEAKRSSDDDDDDIDLSKITLPEGVTLR